MVELSPPLQELQCGARRTAPGGHRSPLSVLAHMRLEEIAPRLSHSTRTTAVPSLSKPPAPRPLPTAGPGAPEPGQNAQQQQGDGLRVRCGLKRSPGSRSFPRPSHDAAARLGPDRRPAQLSACPTSRHRLPPWRTPGRTAHSAPAESRRPVPPAPAVPRIRAQPATRRAEGARRPSLQPLPYAGKLRLEGTASTRVPAAGLAPPPTRARAPWRGGGSRRWPRAGPRLLAASAPTARGAPAPMRERPRGPGAAAAAKAAHSCPCPRGERFAPWQGDTRAGARSRPPAPVPCDGEHRPCAGLGAPVGAARCGDASRAPAVSLPGSLLCSWLRLEQSPAARLQRRATPRPGGNFLGFGARRPGPAKSSHPSPLGRSYWIKH